MNERRERALSVTGLAHVPVVRNYRRRRRLKPLRSSACRFAPTVTVARRWFRGPTVQIRVTLEGIPAAAHLPARRARQARRLQMARCDVLGYTRDEDVLGAEGAFPAPEAAGASRI